MADDEGDLMPLVRAETAGAGSESTVPEAGQLVRVRGQQSEAGSLTDATPLQYHA
jgi:hypothetical protein